MPSIYMQAVALKDTVALQMLYFLKMKIFYIIG